MLWMADKIGYARIMVVGCSSGEKNVEKPGSRTGSRNQYSGKGFRYVMLVFRITAQVVMVLIDFHLSMPNVIYYIEKS